VTTIRPVLALTVLGIALGSLTAAYLTRFVESQLYAVEPLDVPTFTGAAVGMFVVAGLAALLPSRRAVRVNPCDLLRHD
jgi:ABC-type lipoprotein release transport system permease subunit